MRSTFAEPLKHCHIFKFVCLEALIDGVHRTVMSVLVLLDNYKFSAFLLFLTYLFLQVTPPRFIGISHPLICNEIHSKQLSGFDVLMHLNREIDAGTRLWLSFKGLITRCGHYSSKQVQHIHVMVTLS